MMAFIKRMMPVLIWLLIGTVMALYLVPEELAQMEYEVPGMPESYPIEQKCRPILLLLLCYLPFIGTVIYSMMGTMDRYMTRNFITYFLMCTLILLLIYILADFTENMSRFASRFENPVLGALKFYGLQMPMFLYQILPYTLMMGVLWSLSKLSTTCELTGMLQSGRSLLRVCRPIFIFSCLVAVAYGICGFHWAPNGSLYRQMTLKGKKLSDKSPTPPLVYRSDSTARFWVIKDPATFADPGAPMRSVKISQFDMKNKGNLIRQYEADSAVWNKQDATWTLNNVYIRDMGKATDRPADDHHEEVLVCDFSEKPYQIISPSQNGRIDAMGTSALYEFIKTKAGSREQRYRLRTEWHVRIARIFTCVVLVLLAIPSAVTFQRRGTMKGIGIAVLLAALMLFLYRVFPSLGEAGLIQAWISAWLPNAIYIGISIWLFRKNLAHRSFREWFNAKLKGKP